MLILLQMLIGNLQLNFHATSFRLRELLNFVKICGEDTELTNRRPLQFLSDRTRVSEQQCDDF